MDSPRRIVSLISSATEILYLLGLGDRVVGVSHECDFPPEVAHKPRLTRSLVEATASSRDIDNQVRTLAANSQALYTIDAAQLAALAPDLIVTQAQCDVCAVRYEDVVSVVRGTPQLAHTQVLALNPRSLAEVLDDVQRVANACGAPAAGQATLEALTARIAALESHADALSPGQRPRVACLEWIEPPMLAANWTPDLVRIAGGTPILTTAGIHSSYASWTQIVAEDPDLFVVMPCGFDLPRAIAEAQVLPRWPDWSSLSAIAAQRVFAVDGNAYFNRSGPRLVDSAEILAHLFHPQRFAPPANTTGRAFCRLLTRDGTLITGL